MKKVLVLKAGGAFPALSRARGGVEDWLRRKLGLRRDGIRTVSIFECERPPTPESVGAVIITGSKAMVTDRRPWSEAAAQWLIAAMAAERPILGICYGHQLLAHALGGLVGPNPHGREIGTTRVDLNAAGQADPLFSHFFAPSSPRSSLRVQMLHQQAVLRIPEGAVPLARNAYGDYQALRFRPNVWGVQFHPEFDADIMGHYLAHLRADLWAEGLNPDVLAAGLADSAAGAGLLRRFLKVAGEHLAALGEARDAAWDWCETPVAEEPVELGLEPGWAAWPARC